MRCGGMGSGHPLTIWLGSEQAGADASGHFQRPAKRPKTFSFVPNVPTPPRTLCPFVPSQPCFIWFQSVPLQLRMSQMSRPKMSHVLSEMGHLSILAWDITHVAATWARRSCPDRREEDRVFRPSSRPANQLTAKEPPSKNRKIGHRIETSRHANRSITRPTRSAITHAPVPRRHQALGQIRRADRAPIPVPI